MNRPDHGTTLGDLGEQRILSELIMPTLTRTDGGHSYAGDDCAELVPPSADEILVLTTDPCPTPVVFELGDRDYWHFGRMTMLINLSDISAMGARPLGLLVSVEMPEDMPAADFSRFQEGLVSAAEEWHCPIVGGNIRDSRQFAVTGTAVGSVARDGILRRSGSRVGDQICVVGTMGLFWAAVITRLRHITELPDGDPDALTASLYWPRPRTREAALLSQTGMVTACIDSSDGVESCLRELARVNGVDFVLDAGLLTPSAPVDHVADRVGIDARKLLLAWGNWELVITVRQDCLDEVLRMAAQEKFPCTHVGEVTAGTGKVLLAEHGKAREVNSFASERFTGSSYFTHGLGAYVERLETAPLTL